MSRATRKTILEKIEQRRGSKVLCYVTGDRAPVPAQIGDDAVRPLYEHLRRIDATEKLDFFIYSRGGAIDVPWRLNTAFRAVGKSWAALIPFRANSAATLLAMGADEIVLGRHGELGPIDPIMTMQRLDGGRTVIQDAVSVEDVMAYMKFVQERAGLSDQGALATGLSQLTERLDAVSLGSAYRTHSHIRDVARRMLLSRNEPGTEQTISTIVETLAERVYAHGHAIGQKIALEIGLPAKPADKDLDGLLWELLLEYEQDMKLLEPLDPAAAVASNDKFVDEWTMCMIDSVAVAHEFSGRIEINARRQMPQNMNVNLNLNFPIPASIVPALQGAPAQFQQLLQQFMQQVQQATVQQAQQAVQEAMKQQAPMVGIDVAFRDGRWRLVEG